MGNKIARTTQVSDTEFYLHDLPSSYNLVLKEVLARGRFLKSILCKHDEGLVLVKVYFKRGDSIDLKEYERRLSQIKEIFLALPHPHVWPFQVFFNTHFLYCVEISIGIGIYFCSMVFKIIRAMDGILVVVKLSVLLN